MFSRPAGQTPPLIAKKPRVGYPWRLLVETHLGTRDSRQQPQVRAQTDPERIQFQLGPGTSDTSASMSIGTCDEHQVRLM